MPGRTCYAAWQSYSEPMNKALQCIALQKGFVLNYNGALAEEVEYSVTLQSGESVLIATSPPIYLVALQSIKFYQWHPDVADERFRVRALSYFYALTTRADGQERELLTFHWHRHRAPGESTRYPLGHLHIGSALFESTSQLKGKDFHKAHIPTGRLSFESIVRFAVVELDLDVSGNWDVILDTTEEAFQQNRTDERSVL